MPSRRTFLSTTLAAGAAVALPAIASAPASASDRLRRRVPKESISIQLYTLRDIMGDDPEPVLSALADIGYRKVELAGTYGRSAAEFAAVLRRCGLRATSSHVGIDGDLDRVIADARTLGHKYVVVPWVDYGTLAEWRAFTARLETAGEKLRRAGLSLGYHNHAHEFAPVEGTRPFDVITAGTTCRNVHLEVDLYWAVTGGVDPVEVYRANFPRVRQFHVKDRAADGSFADPGTGTIDFARIFRAANVAEYIVENDQPRDALATARIGYQYLVDLRF